MHQLFIDLRNLVFDTLFPLHCLGCEEEGSFLCQRCQTKLQPVTQQVCIMCRLPSAKGRTHDNCTNVASPDGLISAFNYQDPLLNQAIIFGKYKFLPDIYRTLGQLLAEYMISKGYDRLFTNAVLCPIPLARRRLRWRGFNQSAIIVQVLSSYFKWENCEALVRIKNTKTQKDLNKAERLKNVSNSFTLLNASIVQNKNIILIDDVITTGATLLEATKLLKEYGANQVWCVTIARD